MCSHVFLACLWMIKFMGFMLSLSCSVLDGILSNMEVLVMNLRLLFWMRWSCSIFVCEIVLSGTGGKMSDDIMSALCSFSLFRLKRSLKRWSLFGWLCAITFHVAWVWMPFFVTFSHNTFPFLLFSIFFIVNDYIGLLLSEHGDFCDFICVCLNFPFFL